MMKRPNLSAKRIAIDKANASLIIIVSVAAFIVVFSIIATKALYSQLTYQSKVIDKKEFTLKQVNKNIEEVAKLNTAYQEFSGSSENILGGNPKGTGDKDGENARIILDALPSRYDYPALTSSVDKLLKGGGFKLTAFTGSDDEAAQSVNQSAVTPAPIDMPFVFESTISPGDGKKFFELFERSIRPMQIQKITGIVQENNLKLEVAAKTYYQPEKKLNVTQEVVK